MTTDDEEPGNNENHPTREASLTCTKCQTPEYLILETVDSTIPKIHGRAAVQYSCGNCESFYAQDTSVEEVAVLLQSKNIPADILNFGNTYIHCGEPMTKGELRVVSSNGGWEDSTDIPVVQVESEVLPCHISGKWLFA